MQAKKYSFPDAVIQVFCKAPVPGQVKTRLMPDLSADQAADVHQQLTLRTLELVCRDDLCEVQLWCSPTVSHPFFTTLEKQFSLTLFLQTNGDLGERMYKALCSGTEQFKNVILIGSDCPSLTKSDLVSAINGLDSGYNTVLAPAEDDGYCLIGSSVPRRELFANINWGSSEVLAKTREKIIALDLNCLELKTQWDVDNYQDYLRFLGL